MLTTIRSRTVVSFLKPSDFSSSCTLCYLLVLLCTLRCGFVDVVNNVVLVRLVHGIDDRIDALIAQVSWSTAWVVMVILYDTVLTPICLRTWTTRHKPAPTQLG